MCRLVLSDSNFMVQRCSASSQSDWVDLVACFGQSHRGGVSQSETECPTLPFLLRFMMNIKERERDRERR